jgi:glutamate N-acetyltransferase/amino-acid N-acetyltransferase
VSLAKMIAKDGEGATKLVEVLVTGARTEDEAVQAARAVANSNLVKTAIHGEDANWGRIIAAVGYSGIDFDPEQMQLSINDVPILDKQYTIVIDEVEAKKALAMDTVTISIDLNQGMSEACFWTCDLTKDYVHINASYRS